MTTHTTMNRSTDLSPIRKAAIDAASVRFEYECRIAGYGLPKVCAFAPSEEAFATSDPVGYSAAYLEEYIRLFKSKFLS